MELFDRQLLKYNKQRSFHTFNETTFLHDLVYDSLANRLFIKHSYENALIIGARNTTEFNSIIQSPLIKHITYGDNIIEFLREFSGNKVLLDEEKLPFANHSFDLIVSVLNIHTINDVGSFLMRIRKVLKPGGVFIGSLFGSKTLYELKESFVKTELRMNLPVTPHIMPLTDVKEIANAASKCGFIEPVSDSELVTVHYSKIGRLFRDLRNIGETNILISRSRNSLSKSFYAELETSYKQNFSIKDGSEFLFPASFEILHLTAF
jgi:NADH dehydrogenase [ubiquinone] 1 alpha subcomplex assembly factor 5